MTSSHMYMMKPTSAWSYPPTKRGEPEPQFACVTKRLQDANGLLIGKAKDKPILDTHMYKV